MNSKYFTGFLAFVCAAGSIFFFYRKYEPENYTWAVASLIFVLITIANAKKRTE